MARPWINVSDFGANGNGQPDDWQAIINAIAAIDPAGGVLFFSPGVYISSGPIYIANKNNFVVLGYGATIQIQDSRPYERNPELPSPWHDRLGRYPLAYSGDQFSVLEIFNCSDWKVLGLRLDGNYNNRGASQKEGNHGIQISGCHRFTVQSVEVQYCQGDGITLTPMNQLGFADPNKRSTESNCSNFALLDIKAHNIARISISFAGARNGFVDGLIDHDIGTDPRNYTLTPASIHFEVDGGEEDYAVCEWINVTNLNCRNHAITRSFGGFIGFSRGSRFISVSNFLYEQDAGIVLPNQTETIWSLVGVGATVPTDFFTVNQNNPWPQFEPQHAHHIRLSDGVIRVRRDVFAVLRKNQIVSWGFEFQSTFQGVRAAEPTAQDLNNKNNNQYDGWGVGTFIYNQATGNFRLLIDKEKGRWIDLETAEGSSLQEYVSWTSPYHVAIEGLTIDGLDVGIMGCRNTKDILIANNLILNASQCSLCLRGQCSVVGNHLVDVNGMYTPYGFPSFIRVDDPFNKYPMSAPIPDSILCEHNVLRFSLTWNPPPPPPPGPEFYFWVTAGNRGVSANYNKCYGLRGYLVNRFDSSPASFLENKFGDNTDQFTGTFGFTGENTVTVLNTNVWSSTQVVLIVPTSAAGGQLMQDQGLYVSEVRPYESFAVSTADGQKAAAVGLKTFGYRLS